MNTCWTCKWWGVGHTDKTAIDWYPCELTVTDGTYDAGPKYPESHAVVVVWGHACEGQLNTRADFGCVQWAPVEPVA